MLATNPHMYGRYPIRRSQGGEHEQRLVTAAQARHQDHRPAIAARHAASTKERIDEQPAELERPATLAEMISPASAHPSAPPASCPSPTTSSPTGSARVIEPDVDEIAMKPAARRTVSWFQKRMSNAG